MWPSARTPGCSTRSRRHCCSRSTTTGSGTTGTHSPGGPESRLRIVEEGYLARRRLERDLHDGSQQLLVSLAIGLRIATAKAQEAGNAEVVVDLERASAQLADALRELRELARGIHPTVLTDGDLRSALSELALRSHAPVEVTSTFDERLPDVVEETIYFVVAECLTNAAKHAEARNCAVTVTRATARCR